MFNNKKKCMRYDLSTLFRYIKHSPKLKNIIVKMSHK